MSLHEVWYMDSDILEEPACSLFRVQEFFPSNPEDGNARFCQDDGTYVSDTTASHSMNP